MTALLKVRVPGKGDVSLSQKDYLATGGEGTVYAKNGLVYKLYLDPVSARARGIEEKIDLLSRIQHPYVVSPIGVVENAKHETVGFYMEEAPGVPLVKTFTNAWRDPNKFGMKESLQLVQNMRDALACAHALGAVTVDANEMNYLAHGVEPRMLDVDSWQIGRFKASAVMPSIRDPFAIEFTTESDWFAWAVVSFQVLTGIHPYKGSHPNFKRGDMLGRMREKVSVLDTAVSVNAGVRDFSGIPAHLLEWYRAVFHEGLRELPPSSIMVPARSRTPAKKSSAGGPLNATKALTYQVLWDLPGNLLSPLAGGFALVESAAGLVLCDLQRKQTLDGASDAMLRSLVDARAALIRVPEGVLFASLGASEVQACLLYGNKDPRAPGDLRSHSHAAMSRSLPLAATKLHAWDNRLFALNPDSESGLLELQVNVLAGNPLLSVRSSWPFLAKSSAAFLNMAMFSALGQPYLVLPAGDAVGVERCPALIGYEVLDAVMLSSARVEILTLKRADGLTYRMSVVKGASGVFELMTAHVTDLGRLWTAVNERGVGLSLQDNAELVVFNLRGGSKVLANSGLDETASLVALPAGFCLLQGQTLTKVSLSA